jgi:hypothetical protein
MNKNLVLVLGVVLTLVGLWGFFADGRVLWFDVNALHNIVHLASGLLAIVFAMRGEAGAVTFSKVFGVVYALVAVLGFVAGDFTRSLLNTNSADHWLHLVLAVVFLWIGFGTRPAMNNSNGGMGGGMNS